MKGLFTTLAISSSLLLAGCNLTDEEKEQLEKAGENLEQLADQIIITYPAKNSTVKNSIVTVRADVPEELNATKVSLFVDGIEIAYDDNGAPWEIEWPAYYWADDNNHSLLLKTTTESGSQVRNNESYQVEVSSEANDMLGFTGNLDGKQLQDTDELAINFNEVPYATRYEVKYGDKTNSETGTATLLKNLQVGNYQLAYRALYDFSESTTLKGAWSESVAIEVLPPEIPVITGPVIGENEKGFTATFTWDSGNVEDKLTFKAVNNSSHQPVIVDVNADKGAAMIEGLDVGEFSWSVELENSYSHKNESEVKNFQINEITAPVVYEPVKGYTEAGHTLEFSWKPVAASDKYSVLIKGYPNENSFVEYESADLSKLLVGELGFGEHQWKIKRTSISGRTIESEVMATNIFEPTINHAYTKAVSYEGMSRYGILFNGDEKILAGAKYEIGLTPISGTEYFEDCVNSCIFNELKIGTYTYRIKRTNPVGQVSYSGVLSLNVGVFKRRFGGSADDSARHVITTRDGGFLILASSKSKGDAQGDDWFIKLDANGNTEWEYVLRKSGRSRLSDLREFSDGSIYAYGSNINWLDAKGYLIKLSGEATAQDRLLWEVEYRHADSEKERFHSLTENSTRLFVASSENTCVTTNTGSTRCSISKSKLVEFDTETGAYVSSFELPALTDGSELAGLGYLSTTSDGDFLLACTARPQNVDEDSGYGGACLMKFDSSGVLDWSHSYVNDYHFISGSYGLEAPWGDYVLLGQTYGGSNTAFARISSTGSKAGTYTAGADTYPIQRETVVFDDNENMLMLLSGRYTDLPELWSTSKSGYSNKLKVFEELKRDNSYPRSLDRAEDGGVILLFNEDQSGYNNTDIVVLKTDINGNM